MTPILEVFHQWCDVKDLLRCQGLPDLSYSFIIIYKKGLTSVPVTPGLEVLLLSNGPAEATRVEEYVSEQKEKR